VPSHWLRCSLVNFFAWAGLEHDLCLPDSYNYRLEALYLVLFSVFNWVISLLLLRYKSSLCILFIAFKAASFYEWHWIFFLCL
jgi:hypothetical protein